MGLINKFLKEDHFDNLDLPFDLKINFSKAFDYWSEISNDKNNPKSHYAGKVLEQINHASELKEDITDFSIIQKYEKEVALLLTDFFPEALQSNEIKAISMPFTSIFINPTQRFTNLLENAPDDFEFELRGVDMDRMYIFAGTFLLNALFGANIDYKKPLFIDIPNKKTGLVRHFRVFFNADFSIINWNDDFPRPTPEQLKELKDNYDKIEIWRRIIPKGSVEINGFTMMILQDITSDQILSNIKNLLLEKNSLKDQVSIDRLQTELRNYLSVPDLKFGFSFLNAEEGQINVLGGENSHSLVMCDKYEKNSDDLYCEYSYDLVFQSGAPIAISKLDEEPIRNIGFAKNLLSQNINSYIVSAVKANDKIIGLFELGSSKEEALHTILIYKLSEVIPLFTVAMSRMREEYHTKLEALVQEKYTAIHPSVEWKFFEEAAAYLLDPENEVKDIAFNDVYPLFAQADIKGSSTLRNESIQKDLIAQLESAKEIINTASMEHGYPIYEVLIYKIEKYIESVSSNLNAGDEVKVLSFLDHEIHSTLEHLKANHKGLDKAIQKYYSGLDPHLGLVYQKRKDFDQSVTKLNEGISKVLLRSQEEAQGMFPHYFQHYKTDGVEYNIYVGDSLVKGRKFDKLLLKNLRLWQLITTYRVENKVHRMQKKLKVPLEICSLILVHSNPLAIKFRMDEKQFDVDGAYNIRYEIVKKRIDKSLIKGTSDRLTVPGKIAIVYSQDTDREEYLVYLEYLKSINMIKDEVEQLELEDLKGASGLKALRVTVNYGDDQKEKKQDIDKLIQEVMEK